MAALAVAVSVQEVRGYIGGRMCMLTVSLTCQKGRGRVPVNGDSFVSLQLHNQISWATWDRLAGDCDQTKVGIKGLYPQYGRRD